MKKKSMKRVISILLSIAVLCCAVGMEGLLISAGNRYDITLTITYPRSGEAPEIPSDFESLSSLDLTYLVPRAAEWSFSNMFKIAVHRSSRSSSEKPVVLRARFADT